MDSSTLCSLATSALKIWSTFINKLSPREKVKEEASLFKTPQGFSSQDHFAFSSNFNLRQVGCLSELLFVLVCLYAVKLRFKTLFLRDAGENLRNLLSEFDCPAIKKKIQILSFSQ